jgi:hypothetical protein
MVPAVAAIALCLTQVASAASPSCEAQAVDKHLPLAAETKLIKQCQKDAVEVASRTCEDQADTNKLTGRTKTTFVKKCVKDATASKRPANSFPGVG